MNVRQFAGKIKYAEILPYAPGIEAGWPRPLCGLGSREPGCRKAEAPGPSWKIAGKIGILVEGRSLA
jgi:hypothetical protein